MMQKSSTAQSPTQTTQVSHTSDKLHPVLQNVLVGLDVQLEEELFRYRRQRALGKTSYKPVDPSFRKVSNALKSVSGTAASISLPPIASEGAAAHSSIDLPPFTAATPQPASVISQGEAETTIENFQSEETNFNEAIEEDINPSGSSLPEIQELAKQYASQVADSSDLTIANTGGPDDYLESSEELLRALSREEAEVQAEQSFMHSLLTPLGFGSMLLLLLSSAMFGFVITNPSSVSQLFATQKAAPSTNSNDGTVAPSSTQSSDIPQPNLANQEFPELSVSTLGTIEIDQENKLPSAKALPAKAPASSSALINIGLSGTTGTSAPSPVPNTSPQIKGNDAAPPAKAPSGDIPSPRRLAPSTSVSAPVQRASAPPARSYDPAPPPARSYDSAPVRTYSPPPARAYRPQPIQPFQPAPRKAPASAPASSEMRTPPPPSAPAVSSAASSSGNGYKVVSPYTSDRALEDARQSVPDAYVKNYPDGAKVQFGAYSDEAAAKAQVEELQKQGIPAEVYKP